MLINFIKRHKFLTLLTIITLIFQIIGTLYVPFLVGRLIDVGIASKDFNQVVTISLEMFVFAIFTGFIGTASSYLTAKITAQFSSDTTIRIFEKIQTFSLSDTNKYGVASLLTRSTSDIENISMSGVLFIQMIIPAPIISIISLVMTYTVSKELVWIPIVLMTIFFIVVCILMYHGNKYSKVVQEKMDNIMRSIREFYTGIRVIRAFDNESFEKDKTDKTFKDYAENMIILNKIFALLTPTVQGLLGIAMTAILWFGVFEVGAGRVQIGSITAVVQYTTITLMYLMIAAMVLITLPNALESVRRITEVLDYTPEILDRKITHSTSIETNSNELVSFNNVTFTYPDAEEPVLNDISFTINRGETVAIVGSTGSGKSTIGKLLLRFNDVSSGSIKIKGTDIRQINQELLRTIVSYVPQKAFLFRGSIKENLTYGNEIATLEELEKATKIAQAYDFIQNLPDNFSSFVAQGGLNFSGGQRQRLSIARALTKKSDIYIFDDSFSALDYKTDALVREALKKEMTDVAKIIVAQRLSTVTDADLIILLDEGRIIGAGKHKELLANNQVYRSFAKSQNLLPEEGETND
ncbi:ABC transporter ATP-binding protein [Aerococcus urinaeequi]|uniref:ABC transporter ATP-binding protein n=1 Tax=Aerococcus urinaeequi TaxID=51665 RepID=UPI0008461EDA|nr:ABC transporter ATP-binding protein [Aerococcus urinaeequi]